MQFSVVRKKAWLRGYARRKGISIPKGFRVGSPHVGRPCRDLIKAAQREGGLKAVTGRFDHATTWLIMPLRWRIVSLSAEELGVREWPAGSNRGKRVEEFLRAAGLGPGSPWCASFCWWVLVECGYRGYGPITKGWVPSWEEWGQKKGLLVNKLRAQRGDFVTFKFGHIGIVTRNYGLAKRVASIDGNIGAHGGSVAHATRPFWQVDKVIRVK
jgi:hypothetical protein